jgi:hypothetical protein
MSKASDIRAHAIDEAIAAVDAAICLADRRCQDRASGEACEYEPDEKLWCDSCKLQGEALE